LISSDLGLQTDFGELGNQRNKEGAKRLREDWRRSGERGGLHRVLGFPRRRFDFVDFLLIFSFRKNENDTTKKKVI